ncbi:MAG TPA: hypothetical protein VKA18_09965 [Alphaproteobacteria bacterium]|nr:hypothetical protein [Alphaproteobacteria bacterium]
MVSRPISDKAEVSIDFPEKFYHGSFGHQSRYEVTADDEGVHIYLVRGGPERRHVGFHVHYQLLADLLDGAADAAAKVEDIQPYQREKLRAAAAKFAEAMSR